MIHVISHHIAKGSWNSWYDILLFNEDESVKFYTEFDREKSERKLIGEPPYFDKLLHILESINSKDSTERIKEGDIVFVDIAYFDFNLPDDEYYNHIKNLSIKYKCKFFIIDTDNQFSFTDNQFFTIFSNRFDIQHSDINFNYFRYRARTYNIIQTTPNVISPYLENLRLKKANLIVGVDKPFRLVTLKHFYNTGLNKDSHIGYSAFTKAYDDSVLSKNLIKFRDETLPIILDTPMSKSEMGAVNVEYPPLPITLTSYVSCILETQMCMGDEIHLSEKAWNPFISFNIPLILGSLKLNEYLKSLGFWLAEDLFDISTQKSGDSLIKQYLNNLDILNAMSMDELHQYYVKNLKNIHDNYHLLMNQKWYFNKDSYKKYKKEWL